MQQNIKPRNNLDEVSFIRPILIVLLVLYHAFAPWCGAWSAFEGYEPNTTYWWIAKTAYSFMLPMFVFVSGYVWAFQRETLNKRDTFRQLLAKKFKRLYIPSLIFSIAYIAIFKGLSFMREADSLWGIIIDVLSGYAHMWFLPMLIWTFILMWCILRINKRWIRWCTVIALCVISFLPIPLGINTSFYYIIYFYAGYEALIYANKLKELSTPRVILVQWIIFIFTFISLTLLNEEWMHFYAERTIIVKVIGIVSTNAITKVYGFFGVLALFCTSLYYTAKHQLSNTIIQIGAYCFGVYLFQQFILQWIYYNTDIPILLGSSLLPWVSFLVTLVISMLLSAMVKKTKIGNFLI